ncbi:hypothetical protein SS1G_11579 [Sclerotinia sclerotiorum 1980 UF-70]|uniref:Mannan endo-1,6-alpha-mannosidase n=2 Tax=Sclerotinia sclerotiorum (strain ATCC 18683 / 1980 / Ss-1) TaxID=665079 RepID=A7F1V8_SCLS1|nr:hypothetical protein SS1G_11579 [Sclerotinia sclerotiorum 1980 UF-70]APA11333.1 hypothetical protein sscle_07g061030 [Sclerotinia sclerotiorum 1980 UF-70]EDN95700.1 hypothetical protein SS1G_11579 [Sclerotinia sclerotiorum 1980 UF-70]
MVSSKLLVAFAAVSVVPIQCINLNVTSVDSIKSAASTIARDLVGLYNQSQTAGNPIGVLNAPYYWWESGAMFDTLIQYWRLTGDSQYNRIVTQGLVYQQGIGSSFMPENQTKFLANDDQSTWALAAMSAAEARLGEVQNVTWLNLAENVFNEQVARWDEKTCNGGLRWQIFTFNAGYTYKNSISNGNFFQLSARLAAYTGNTTYSDWATKVWNWTKGTGLIDENFNVFDGADVTKNCSMIDKPQFSETAGTFIAGAAYMYNHTNGDSQWKKSLDGLLNRTISVFFPSGIATETACESKNACNIDQRAYKGILGKWLVDTIQVAPYTNSIINTQLIGTAQAAARTCGDNGCAFDWSGNGKNVSTGVGEQIDALSYVQGLLHSQAAAPATQNSSNSTTSSSGSSTSTSASAIASASNNAATGMVLEQSAISFSVMGAVAWLVL